MTSRVWTMAEVEAVQWTGDNRDAVLDFLGEEPRVAFTDDERRLLRVGTGPTVVVVSPGDWLITVKGMGFVAGLPSEALGP